MHTLIIGGTGMLRQASIALAARSQRLTSVARTQRSLAALDAVVPAGSGQHDMLPLDWSAPDNFLDEIERHLAQTGPPDLVLAWIHQDYLALRLASRLSQNGHPLRFYHVIGSSGPDPSEIAQALLARIEEIPHLHYHQVILGAVKTNWGTRWLTNQEISAGVLEAIEKQQSQFVVGTLDRWHS
jgi:NAD(P)-dependent dehydrogenase (short-subunit alcohol dehydrogenase family)